jgi:hypothetical protein
VSIPLRAIAHAITELEFQHFARPKLIATPHRSRDPPDHLEEAPRTIFLVGQSPRTVYGLGDVGNVSVAPHANLVAEYPKSACPATADGASGNDAPLLPAQVWDRRLLDDERPLRDLDLERGVVEIAPRTPLNPGHERLVGATVEPDEVPTCAERQPVQVDPGGPFDSIASEQLSSFWPNAASDSTSGREACP